MTATVAGLVVLAYWIIYGWMVHQEPLTYVEMDFNRDGVVDFG